MSSSADPLRGMLADILDTCDDGSWNDATPIEDLPNMDSLRFTQLVAAVEQRIGRSIEVEELLELELVNDIRKLLSGRIEHAA